MAEVITFFEPGRQAETGNTALMSKASSLVDQYNTLASALAAVTREIYEVRNQLHDDDGKIIISGTGWVYNALEQIPMLKIAGREFPNVPSVGRFFDRQQKAASSHFDKEGQQYEEEHLSSDEAARQGNELAQRALLFQEEEAKKGIQVTISQAVTAVAGTYTRRQYRDSLNVQTYAESGLAAGDLASKIQRVQAEEASKGRFISLAEAITRVGGN